MRWLVVARREGREEKSGTWGKRRGEKEKEEGRGEEWSRATATNAVVFSVLVLGWSFFVSGARMADPGGSVPSYTSCRWT